MRRRALIAGSCFVALVATATAHETWMTPSPFDAKVGEEVRLDVSSGMAFPRLESPIQTARVARAAYRLGSQRGDITSLKSESTSLVLRQSFPTNGVATVWLDLKSKEIDLTDAQVAEYLDEIGATDDVRRLWAGQRGRSPWKETYTKHAKTFIAIGDAANDTSWGVSVGAALELLPVTNPVSVVVGQDFTVELQQHSKPLASLPVGLMIEGSSERVFRTTDAGGRATFPIVKAGRTLIFAVRLVRADDATSWASDFCTLTLEVHQPK